MNSAVLSCLLAFLQINLKLQQRLRSGANGLEYGVAALTILKVGGSPAGMLPRMIEEFRRRQYQWWS